MTSFLKANAFVVVSAMAAIHLASCSTPDTLKQDTTNTFLVVQSVTGEEGSEIFSDVCSLEEESGHGRVLLHVFQ